MEGGLTDDAPPQWPAMVAGTGHLLHRPELAEPLARGDAAIGRAIAAAALPKVFRAGDKIVIDDEPHDFVYRLRTGWICRVRTLPDKRRQIIDVLLAGELFGVKSMFMSHQPDGIECLTDATADAIEQRTLYRLVGEDSDVATRVIWQVLEDERRLHNWVVGLGRGSADERMAAMLLDFHGRLQRLDLVKDGSFRLPMTQQQLGDYLGITPVHVNRVLKSFRDDGLVALERGTATLRDLAGLQRRARPVQDFFERTRPELGGPAT
jgi:CRP/FNR family transcriptional regulator, anaerobic regulatory protein